MKVPAPDFPEDGTFSKNLFQHPVPEALGVQE
jgi:hypothetical protein